MKLGLQIPYFTWGGGPARMGGDAIANRSRR